jgi:hypothetical protein
MIIHFRRRNSYQRALREERKALLGFLGGLFFLELNMQYHIYPSKAVIQQVSEHIGPCILGGSVNV